MTVQAQGATGQAAAATAEAGSGGAAAPAAAANGFDQAAFFKQIDERFSKVEGKITDLGKGLGRVREKVKAPEGDEPAANGAAATAAPNVNELVASAMAYGRAHAKLPANLQAKLDERQAKGAPFDVLLDLAETFHSMLGEAGLAGGANSGDAQRQAPIAPRGAAGTSAQRSSAYPTTLGEYIALAKDDPARKKLLDKDPGFHPEDLPMR